MASNEVVEDLFGFAELTDDTKPTVVKTDSIGKKGGSLAPKLNVSIDEIKRDTDEVVIPILFEKTGLKKYKVLARHQAEDDEDIRRPSSSERDSPGSTEQRKENINISEKPDKHQNKKLEKKKSGKKILVTGEKRAKLHSLKKLSSHEKKLHSTLDKTKISEKERKRSQKEVSQNLKPVSYEFHDSDSNSDVKIQKCMQKENNDSEPLHGASDSANLMPEHKVAETDLSRPEISVKTDCCVKLKRDLSIESLCTQKSNDEPKDFDRVSNCDSSDSFESAKFKESESLESSYSGAVSRQNSTEMVYNADIQVRKSGRLKSAKCASRYRGDYGIRVDTYKQLLSKTGKANGMSDTGDDSNSTASSELQKSDSEDQSLMLKLVSSPADDSGVAAVDSDNIYTFTVVKEKVNKSSEAQRKDHRDRKEKYFKSTRFKDTVKTTGKDNSESIDEAAESEKEGLIFSSNDHKVGERIGVNCDSSDSAINCDTFVPLIESKDKDVGQTLSELSDNPSDERISQAGVEKHTQIAQNTSSETFSVEQVKQKCDAAPRYVHSVGKSVRKSLKRIESRRKSKELTLGQELPVVNESKSPSPEASSERDPVKVLESLRQKLFEKAGADVVEADKVEKQFESKVISKKDKKRTEPLERCQSCIDFIEHDHIASSKLSDTGSVKSGPATPRCVTPRSDAGSEILEEVAKSLDALHRAKRTTDTSKKAGPTKRQRFEEKKFLLRSMVKSGDIGIHDSAVFEVEPQGKKFKVSEKGSCEHSSKTSSKTEACSENKETAKVVMPEVEKKCKIQQKDSTKGNQSQERQSSKPKPVKCSACNHVFKTKELLRKHYPCRVRQTRTWSQNVLRPNRALKRTDIGSKKFVCNLPKPVKQDSNKPRPQLLTYRKTKFRRVKGKRRRRLYQLIQELRLKRKPVKWPHLSMIYDDLSFKEQCLYKLGLFCVGHASLGLEIYTAEDIACFEEHRAIEKSARENEIAFQHSIRDKLSPSVTDMKNVTESGADLNSSSELGSDFKTSTDLGTDLNTSTDIGNETNEFDYSSSPLAAVSQENSTLNICDTELASDIGYHPDKDIRQLLLSVAELSVLDDEGTFSEPAVEIKEVDRMSAAVNTEKECLIHNSELTLECVKEILVHEAKEPEPSSVSELHVELTENNFSQETLTKEFAVRRETQIGSEMCRMSDSKSLEIPDVEDVTKAPNSDVISKPMKNILQNETEIKEDTTVVGNTKTVKFARDLQVSELLLQNVIDVTPVTKSDSENVEDNTSSLEHVDYGEGLQAVETVSDTEDTEEHIRTKNVKSSSVVKANDPVRKVTALYNIKAPDVEFYHQTASIEEEDARQEQTKRTERLDSANTKNDDTPSNISDTELQRKPSETNWQADAVADIAKDTSKGSQEIPRYECESCETTEETSPSKLTKDMSSSPSDSFLKSPVKGILKNSSSENNTTERKGRTSPEGDNKQRNKSVSPADKGSAKKKIDFKTYAIRKGMIKDPGDHEKEILRQEKQHQIEDSLLERLLDAVNVIDSIIEDQKEQTGLFDTTDLEAFTNDMSEGQGFSAITPDMAYKAAVLSSSENADVENDKAYDIESVYWDEESDELNTGTVSALNIPFIEKSESDESFFSKTFDNEAVKQNLSSVAVGESTFTDTEMIEDSAGKELIYCENMKLFASQMSGRYKQKDVSETDLSIKENTVKHQIPDDAVVQTDESPLKRSCENELETELEVDSSLFTSAPEDDNKIKVTNKFEKIVDENTEEKIENYKTDIEENHLKENVLELENKSIPKTLDLVMETTEDEKGRNGNEPGTQLSEKVGDNQDYLETVLVETFKTAEKGIISDKNGKNMSAAIKRIVESEEDIDKSQEEVLMKSPEYMPPRSSKKTKDELKTVLIKESKKDFTIKYEVNGIVVREDLLTGDKSVVENSSPWRSSAESDTEHSQTENEDTSFDTTTAVDTGFEEVSKNLEIERHKYADVETGIKSSVSDSLRMQEVDVVTADDLKQTGDQADQNVIEICNNSRLEGEKDTDVDTEVSVEIKSKDSFPVMDTEFSHLKRNKKQVENEKPEIDISIVSELKEPEECCSPPDSLTVTDDKFVSTLKSGVMSSDKVPCLQSEDSVLQDAAVSDLKRVSDDHSVGSPPVLEKVYFMERTSVHDSEYETEEEALEEGGPPELIPAEVESVKDIRVDENAESKQKELQKNRAERHFLDVFGTVEQSEEQDNEKLIREQEFNYLDEKDSLGRHFSDIVSSRSPKGSQSDLQFLFDQSEKGEVTLAQLKEILTPISRKEKKTSISRDSLLKLKSGIVTVLSKVKHPQKRDPLWLKRDALSAYTKRKKLKKIGSFDSSSDESSVEANEETSFADSFIKRDELPSKQSIADNILQMLTSLEDKGSIARNMSHLLDILAENLGFVRKGAEYISKIQEMDNDSDSDYSSTDKREFTSEEKSSRNREKELIDEYLKEGEQPPSLDEIPMLDEIPTAKGTSIELDSSLDHTIEENTDEVECNFSEEREEGSADEILKQNQLISISDDQRLEFVVDLKGAAPVKDNDTLDFGHKHDTEMCGNCVSPNILEVIPAQENKFKAKRIFKSITELNSIETDNESDCAESFDQETISARLSELKAENTTWEFNSDYSSDEETQEEVELGLKEKVTCEVGDKINIPEMEIESKKEGKHIYDGACQRSATVGLEIRRTSDVSDISQQQEINVLSKEVNALFNDFDSFSKTGSPNTEKSEDLIKLPQSYDSKPKTRTEEDFITRHAFKIHSSLHVEADDNKTSCNNRLDKLEAISKTGIEISDVSQLSSSGKSLVSLDDAKKSLPVLLDEPDTKRSELCQTKGDSSVQCNSERGSDDLTGIKLQQDRNSKSDKFNLALFANYQDDVYINSQNSEAENVVQPVLTAVRQLNENTLDEIRKLQSSSSCTIKEKKVPNDAAPSVDDLDITTRRHVNVPRKEDDFNFDSFEPVGENAEEDFSALARELDAAGEDSVSSVDTDIYQADSVPEEEVPLVKICEMGRVFKEIEGVIENIPLKTDTLNQAEQVTVASNRNKAGENTTDVLAFAKAPGSANEFGETEIERKTGAESKTQFDETQKSIAEEYQDSTGTNDFSQLFCETIAEKVKRQQRNRSRSACYTFNPLLYYSSAYAQEYSKPPKKAISIFRSSILEKRAREKSLPPDDGNEVDHSAYKKRRQSHPMENLYKKSLLLGRNGTHMSEVDTKPCTVTLQKLTDAVIQKYTRKRAASSDESNENRPPIKVTIKLSQIVYPPSSPYGSTSVSSETGRSGYESCSEESNYEEDENNARDVKDVADGTEIQNQERLGSYHPVSERSTREPLKIKMKTLLTKMNSVERELSVTENPKLSDSYEQESQRNDVIQKAEEQENCPSAIDRGQFKRPASVQDETLLPSYSEEVLDIESKSSTSCDHESSSEFNQDSVEETIESEVLHDISQECDEDSPKHEEVLFYLSDSETEQRKQSTDISKRTSDCEKSCTTFPSKSFTSTSIKAVCGESDVDLSDSDTDSDVQEEIDKILKDIPMENIDSSDSGKDNSCMKMVVTDLHLSDDSDSDTEGSSSNKPAETKSSQKECKLSESNPQLETEQSPFDLFSLDMEFERKTAFKSDTFDSSDINNSKTKLEKTLSPENAVLFDSSENINGKEIEEHNGDRTSSSEIFEHESSADNEALTDNSKSKENEDSNCDLIDSFNIISKCSDDVNSSDHLPVKNVPSHHRDEEKIDIRDCPISETGQHLSVDEQSEAKRDNSETAVKSLECDVFQEIQPLPENTDEEMVYYAVELSDTYETNEAVVNLEISELIEGPEVVDSSELIEECLVQNQLEDPLELTSEPLNEQVVETVHEEKLCGPHADSATDIVGNVAPIESQNVILPGNESKYMYGINEDSQSSNDVVEELVTDGMISDPASKVSRENEMSPLCSENLGLRVTRSINVCPAEHDSFPQFNSEFTCATEVAGSSRQSEDFHTHTHSQLTSDTDLFLTENPDSGILCSYNQVVSPYKPDNLSHGNDLLRDSQGDSVSHLTSDGDVQYPLYRSAGHSAMETEHNEEVGDTINKNSFFHEEGMDVL